MKVKIIGLSKKDAYNQARKHTVGMTGELLSEPEQLASMKKGYVSFWFKPASLPTKHWEPLVKHNEKMFFCAAKFEELK